MENEVQQQIRILRASLLTALQTLDSLEQQLHKVPAPPPSPAPPEPVRPTPAPVKEDDLASSKVVHRLRFPLCPHLKGARGTARAYASSRNVCWAEADPDLEGDYERVETAYQDQFCLTERFVECPRFQAAVKSEQT